MRELVEPNTNELLLKRRVDFADVITNEEKLDIGAATLEQVFEGLLRVFCHVIHFIQHDKLEPDFEQILGSDKLVYLRTYYIDASLIGGV